MPTEYENLREVLLQNILAVKIERAKRSVPFNEAKYMVDGEEFINE